MSSSADTVANNLNAEARTPDVRAHLHSEWGLSNVGIGTPRDGVRQFSAAIQNGVSLVDVSSSFVNDALLAAAHKSLPNIASALLCWHRFATDVLNMDNVHLAATLRPPCHLVHVHLQEQRDVQKLLVRPSFWM